jgi:hypothetical protein
VAAVGGFEQIQNGDRCHGNQGEKNVKVPSNFTKFTSCGCCSYQVSAISVWRVTCYDHFCVFQFFSILAILKIPKVVCISTHSA